MRAVASTPGVIGSWFWSEKQELVQRARCECAAGICHWAERLGRERLEELTGTVPVWSCYSMWWSKWRWVWWAHSHQAPLPAVIQDSLRSFSQADISEICLWSTIALFPFPPPLKLSTEVFQLWSIGYQGKDRFSLQRQFSSSYFYVACVSNKQLN